jgi:hypothetical protein
MSLDLKAPERPCKGCRATIPAQPRGPGRPREFHSRDCRRAHYHRLEKEEVERQQVEERERNRRKNEERFRGWRP